MMPCMFFFVFFFRKTLAAVLRSENFDPPPTVSASWAKNFGSDQQQILGRAPLGNYRNCLWGKGKRGVWRFSLDPNRGTNHCMFR